MELGKAIASVAAFYVRARSSTLANLLRFRNPDRHLTSIMKFFTITSVLAAFAAAVAAVPAPDASTSVSVSFDQVYDNANGSLATVACSDGSNGLCRKS
ncbi:hypothetical protein BC629DRAFT_1563477 [Irpex lacteus]|nr:hypothetical protein BC629DRAFT_1563477 [Irpex lacteus]